MTITLPVAKCAVIADVNPVDKNDSTGKPHANSKDKNRAIMGLVLTMPDGKEIRLLIRDCERGLGTLTVPDEA